VRLLGEGGAGKSTLMSVLAGMAPDAGRIRVARRDVRIDSPRSARWASAGLPALDVVPALSVLENLHSAGTDVRLDKVAARRGGRLAALAVHPSRRRAPAISRSASSSRSRSSRPCGGAPTS
jgi:ABC-type uncharacterized transport system ATPase subunit